MQTVLYRNSLRYTEKKFKIEKDFEQLLIDNSKTLFGKNTKNKVDIPKSITLTGSILKQKRFTTK
jgi:hypothetical protein